MKKMLIAMFLVLILGFGVVGYNQAADDSKDVVEKEQQNGTLIVNS
ncbi:hypothetical protein ACFO3D_08155 [Virgibacillus kekensis]|uniref:Uncharacterized protein n=1 Tax=Virgibacillus kekensis TaxID=202261 RepID=A0ABV9DII5_9BACI